MAEFIIENARLAFPSIFKRDNWDGKEGDYKTDLILSDESAKDIRNRIEIIEKQNATRIDLGKMAFKKGNDKVDKAKEVYNGYADKMYISAKNKYVMPDILDKECNYVLEDNGKFEAGCYVNAIVELSYAPTYKYLSCRLISIIYVKEGVSFSVREKKPNLFIEAKKLRDQAMANNERALTDAQIAVKGLGLD